MAQAEVVKKPDSSSAVEEEFLIAADLTLYANPLRSLTAKKKNSPKPKEKEAPKESDKKEETDIIAADLTKYGSPLDDRN